MANYVVKPGDTLSKIGAQFGVPYQQITGYRSGNPNLIYAGETLTIPDKTGATAPVPAPPAMPTSTPTAPQPTPTPTATPAPAPAGQVNPNDANSIKAAYQGYAGWNDPNAIIADFKATGGQGKGGPVSAPTGTPGGAGTAFTGLTNQPTIDLPKIYQNLYTSSGISDKEAQITQKEKQYLEARTKISDNPFLSASMVDKRLARLQNLYNTETLPLKNEIAMKKADVETQLNLQMKQFDINSQQAQLAMSQFNALLATGAYNNASGEDIANITRATGLSSTIIQSAIGATKKKGVEAYAGTVDDASGQWAFIIDKNTGALISKTKIAEAKPKEPTATNQKIADEQQTQKNAVGDIQRGVSLRDIVNHYGIAGGLAVEDLLRIYNSYSPYGVATESMEEVKSGIFYDLQSKSKK